VLAAVAGPDWTVQLHPVAESTNALAAADPVAGTVVVADHQTAGRGRLDRTWETPPGSALTFSAVVDPGLPDAEWPLLPLAAAVAVADALRRCTGVDARLKWPNDVLVGDPAGEGLRDGKVAGILLERVTTADGRPLAVIGIGINVAMRPDQLPVPTATSLHLSGANVDRSAILGAVLHALSVEVAGLASERAWLLERYRTACTTLGQEVRVDLPNGEAVTGVADAIDEHGRLVVAGRAIGAGDVVHVRPRSAGA
jgi:BirA family biotin operon repressor/biotin-[acetyl-CoA-carboxylase] ligase